MVTLEAVNAQSGDSLAREQAEAESKEQVLRSLDRAASSLRGKLGESIGSVQKFATPLEAATTSSLEALQAFSLGQAEHQKFDDLAAIPHLKRALELDPNFVMALATLGVACNNEGATLYWPIYIRGEAFLEARDGAKAAAEYQKILDHRGIAPISPLYFLAHLGLGRAYALQGIQQRQNWRTRISSRCGRMPIRISPF